MSGSPIELQQATPVLRIFDVDKAKEFYVGFLGFKLDWEHRFGDNFPLYAQVSRSGVLLHLSEHHGDGSPGAAVTTSGVLSLRRELAAKQYRYYKPGAADTAENRGSLTVLDPFGNKLIFREPGSGP